MIFERGKLGGAISKGAASMAVVSALVVGLDVVAALVWPARDTPGAVAKLLLFALALFELVPFAGYAALAIALRSRPVDRGAAIAFWLWTVVAVPVLAVGAHVGVVVLHQWG